MSEKRMPEVAAAHEEPDEPVAEAAGNISAMLSAVIPLLLGIGMIAFALQLPLGSVSTPGPGLWPLICGSGVVLSSGALLFHARRIEHPERFTWNVWSVGAGLASLAAFTLLMPFAGFEIPLFLLFFVWLKFLGGESWRLSGTVALAATIVVYALFILVLKLQIPHLI
ncbi:tripartite tricarboxylate transporter TctB family protein [Arthrobacter sp. NPDC089319]|uniref:tripartite tricarboxylate transporter TctB family protein n=1 Tax=Arthrobacter sp. NPDC089319 TaxID=3155915 RepID=UPI00342FE94D